MNHILLMSHPWTITTLYIFKISIFLFPLIFHCGNCDSSWLIKVLCGLCWFSLALFFWITDDQTLRLPGTHAAIIDKIRPPLHVSLNNSVARPCFQSLTGNVFTKWPTIEGNVQGGSDFHLLQQHMYLVTLNLVRLH